MPLADTLWLHPMPDLEVFRHLIDAVRLHGNEMYQHAEKASEESPEYLDDSSFEVFAQFYCWETTF